MRNAAIALIVLALVVTAAPAQNVVQTSAWADKMFTQPKGTTNHDFGSVPHGAQLYHRFPMTNIWAVPLELLNVRTSCGCVTATPSTRSLQPRESGYLDVTMDARRFTGPKTISIYITVGPQFTSTATLHVSAVSRADVVFNPGQVNFGVVPRGQSPTQTIDVEYAGTLDWRVSEVLTNGAPLDVSLEQLYRRPGQPGQAGQVGYRVKATLKADAAPGPFKQELLLKTNDPASPLVPVLVEASVQAPLTVVPGTVSMGSLKAGGEAVSKKVVVRGSRPFHVTAVEGLGDGIDVELPTNAAALQIVTFRYKPAQAGELHRQLRIRTDLDEGTVATVTIEARVAP